MNNSILLSIVIPVYNVEKYLRDNLESIFKQNCVYRDYIEVIIVDDCSPDNSISIANEYKKLHKNIKIIRHEKNKGLGAARNTGLKFLEGKYVWFIDSDDVIVNGCLQMIIDELSMNEEDILMFNAKVLEVDGSLSNYYATYPYTTPVITGVDFLNLTEVPHWQKPVTAWSRVQKVSFLKENKFYYPEGIFFEDEELNLKQLFVANKVRFLRNVFYLYRNNGESIMRTHYSVKKFMDKVRVFISCLNLLYEYKKQYPNVVDKIYSTHLSVLYQMIKIYNEMSMHEREEIRSYIKNLNIKPIKYFSSSYVKFMLYFYPDLYERIRKFL